MDKFRQAFEEWCDLAIEDQDLQDELKNMSQSDIEDAFYRDLAFGTGGLRGIIGAGTNRMNIYTVAKASQGLSEYIKQRCPKEKQSVVIGYDSRNKSDLFAHTAASVFAANNISVYFWETLLPVPTVSYAVRKHRAFAGIMITASHNPAVYNGYKVYGSDGCQITTEAASDILTEIEKIDIFRGIKKENFDTALLEGKIKYIREDVLNSFLEEVKKQSVVQEQIDRSVAIVYSPLNGTGRIPVTRVLKETGFTNITMVKEQEMPDGNFPTCPFPNPEIREAMELGIEYARRENADLLLATDPDCDRCGIAVKNVNGDYQLLTGNETGILLFDFICAQRLKKGTMPEHPVLIKTIVTTDMGEQIANHYGVKTINVLTGFKFIGEQIGFLEKKGEEERYIFGFEESYGYLSGGYVRDKDAVGAAFLICEMFAYYKKHGMNLLEKLEELYKTYGYRLNTLHSYEFDGAVGYSKMQNIMDRFRRGIQQLGGKKVRETLDFSKGIENLPKSDVLKYLLDGSCSVVVRPSGTEPKLKIYISVSSDSMEHASEEEKVLAKELEAYMD